MAAKLYVGNLSYQMTDQKLNDLFSESGKVASALVSLDRATGQSRGFGFVEMASDDEARQAITVINGRNVDGRTLVVNVPKPREVGNRFGGGDHDVASSDGYHSSHRSGGGGSSTSSYGGGTGKSRSGGGDYGGGYGGASSSGSRSGGGDYGGNRS